MVVIAAMATMPQTEVFARANNYRSICFIPCIGAIVMQTLEVINYHQLGQWLAAHRTRSYFRS